MGKHYPGMNKGGIKPSHDPDKVAKIAIEYGIPAAVERFGYNKTTVVNIVSDYRKRHPEAKVPARLEPRW